MKNGEGKVQIRSDVINRLSNLIIEFNTPVVSLYRQGNQEEGDKQFAEWRQRAILFFAEFFPLELKALFYASTTLLENKPHPDVYTRFWNTRGQKTKLVLDDLNLKIAGGQFDVYFDQLEKKFDFDNPNSYRLTTTQKRLLIILVGLKWAELLSEPIKPEEFPSQSRYGKFDTYLDINPGQMIALNPALPDARGHDFQILADDDLLSTGTNSRGETTFYLTQISEDTVTNGFLDKKEGRFEQLQTTVGSPYGFKNSDWVFVQEQKARKNTLLVVFGHQTKSASFDSATLQKNILAKFELAVSKHNQASAETPIALDFRILGAGLGEHLFNEIARDIMSSDVAVFETSDLNPNVMLEMGVALTWGSHVLPIKLIEKEKPPSDISGQTWANYQENGSDFPDPNFDSRLLSMVSRIMREKHSK